MNLTAHLSNREYEVAEVLAFTKNKEEAADKLCIAIGTLAAHSFRIYEKLEINTKAELVIWWFVKNFHIPKDKIPQFCIAVIINASVLLPGDKIFNRRYRTDREIFINYKTTSKN